jgi:DNA-binding NtrC family response regulator
MLERYAGRRGGPIPRFSPEALDALASHDWPGNVRELANAVERATILAGQGGEIRPEHLPTPVAGARRPTGMNFISPATSTPAAMATPSAVAGPHFPVSDGTQSLRDIEMKYIQHILEKHNGNKPAASKELGISLKTLYNKINQLQQT